MSHQGDPRTGQEDAWWGELYDKNAPDTGSAAKEDSLDERFTSASAVVAAEPRFVKSKAKTAPRPDRPAPPPAGGLPSLPKNYGRPPGRGRPDPADPGLAPPPDPGRPRLPSPTASERIVGDAPPDPRAPQVPPPRVPGPPGVPGRPGRPDLTVPIRKQVQKQNGQDAGRLGGAQAEKPLKPVRHPRPPKASKPPRPRQAAVPEQPTERAPSPPRSSSQPPPRSPSQPPPPSQDRAPRARPATGSWPLRTGPVPPIRPPAPRPPRRAGRPAEPASPTWPDQPAGLTEPPRPPSPGPGRSGQEPPSSLWPNGRTGAARPGPGAPRTGGTEAGQPSSYLPDPQAPRPSAAAGAEPPASPDRPDRQPEPGAPPRSGAASSWWEEQPPTAPEPAPRSSLWPDEPLDGAPPEPPRPPVLGTGTDPSPASWPDAGTPPYGRRQAPRPPDADLMPEPRSSLWSDQPVDTMRSPGGARPEESAPGPVPGEPERPADAMGTEESLPAPGRPDRPLDTTRSSGAVPPEQDRPDPAAGASLWSGQPADPARSPDGPLPEEGPPGPESGAPGRPVGGAWPEGDPRGPVPPPRRSGRPDEPVPPGQGRRQGAGRANGGPVPEPTSVFWPERPAAPAPSAPGRRPRGTGPEGTSVFWPEQPGGPAQRPVQPESVQPESVQPGPGTAMDPASEPSRSSLWPERQPEQRPDRPEGAPRDDGQPPERPAEPPEAAPPASSGRPEPSTALVEPPRPSRRPVRLPEPPAAMWPGRPEQPPGAWPGGRAPRRPEQPPEVLSSAPSPSAGWLTPAVPAESFPEPARQPSRAAEFVGEGPPTYDAEPTAWAVADPDRLGDLVPDTVLDGARYGSVTLRALSLRGDSARYRGEPRRDALLTARFGEGDGALLFVAMAGGTRAAGATHRAARDICAWLGGAVGRSHARLSDDIRGGRRGELKSGLHRLTDRSYGRLRARAAELDLRPEEYTAAVRCLLLTADPACRTRVFFGVGPGGLFRLREGAWQDLDPDPEPFAGLADEPLIGYGAEDRMTVDLGIPTPGLAPVVEPPDVPGEPFRFRASAARPGDTLLLCSAGLAEPLRGEPELGARLAKRWTDGEPPGLAAFLGDVQLRVKGYADDRTACALWEA
ncbi:protein phosphatase 2C domain-containing protein [Streptomyces albireticuli]|uniref:protein phosphatase 2C domain-containing protein n=1 Tax=Streptomyces albireticuli TaxID=1940 RepID=UPI002D21A9F8|nr:protein phosphatase 2C domain-containing protein [Streptomyces albireticuli]